MTGLHRDRLALASRLAASRLPNATAFLAREIDGQVGCWLVELFRAGAGEAAEVLARVFYADVNAWVRRAAPPGALAGVEDRVQDVFAALLEKDGRSITAYRGGGPFRAFLRTVVVNLAAESARREHGRYRPGASPGTVVGRPRLVSLNDDDHPIDPADDRDDPEAALLALEELLARTEREGAVLAALRQLPDESRRVLEARFLEGRKPREIAAMIGRDVKEVYRILERTLAHLKQLLV
jgi:RNA polymerase sigma factor (sigma-70 family)